MLPVVLTTNVIPDLKLVAGYVFAEGSVTTASMKRGVQVDHKINFVV